MESPENYSFDGDCTIADFKTALADVRANLDQARLNGLSPSKLLQNHSKFIDSLLVNAWRHFFEAVPPSQAQELIAVGGYGRQELHPYSDIDLLVLLPKIASEHQERQIEAFIRFLWDIGLEVGHSTRAIKDCIEWARKETRTFLRHRLEAKMASVQCDAEKYEACYQHFVYIKENHTLLSAQYYNDHPELVVTVPELAFKTVFYDCARSVVEDFFDDGRYLFKKTKETSQRVSVL